MDDYQMLQQRGLQELVRVALDEEGLPCVYLCDINRVFPNASVISAYGIRIPFTIDSIGVPKQPLRIPYLENRVLDVESDNSALEWSREATAARIAAAAASAAASITPMNTVHTSVARNLDSDLDYDNNDSDNDSNNAESEDFFDMTETIASSDSDDEEELIFLSRTLCLPTPIPVNNAPVAISEMTLSSSASSVRTLGTVQSFERLRPGSLMPVLEQDLLPVHEHAGMDPAVALITPPVFTRDSPPAFDEIDIVSTQLVPAALVVTSDIPRDVILEEPEEDSDAPAPPSYELVDTGAGAAAEQQLRDSPTIERLVDESSTILDDPAERHLVHDRIEIIKRTTQSILGQGYGAESCPHPPLFILLPENPLQWSPDNILHNKMRLHFLCDCCEHEITTYNTRGGQEREGTANKRNLHVNESKGFEVRMDQFQDQMLLIKFGHYIVNLLRLLKYGVSLDDMFVPAAFDRPVPPRISRSGTPIAAKSGLEPQLFFQLRQNTERSIAFMETLLGDDYEDEVAEATQRLDLNDFRLLDAIIKRPPYAQSAVTTVSSSLPEALTSDQDQEVALGDMHLGGSGLYRVIITGGKVRWACEKYYNMKHQNLDQIFANRLEALQIMLDPHTRVVSLAGESESQLNARMLAISRIKALFRIDITLGWDLEESHFETCINTLTREATTASTISIRIRKNLAPLTWRKQAQSRSGDKQQPISAIINLIKNRNIKHLLLEGDIDLTSVPNIGTMDFSNLDILSIMKSNNRGYNNFSSTSSIGDSNTPQRNGNGDGNYAQSTPRIYTQESYIPILVSFLQSCSFLTELSLGFPDAVPGHIRILQACTTSLSRLQRLELFRVLSSTRGSGGSGNRKLELSASLSASKLTRLYLVECKTTSEGKARLLESLEELLMDSGPYLEDLELRYIGFNDKHAHALEFGTKPVTGRHACRLRRLVIHGKGLESRGVSALRRVLRRATKPIRLNAAVSANRRGSRDSIRRGQNSYNVADSSRDTTVAIATAVSSAEDLEATSFGVMLEQATLTHLELCSIDTLNDSDWASLLSELSLKRIITLDLQGTSFGDRAVAMLARTGGDDIDDFSSSSSFSTSPPQSLDSVSLYSMSFAPPAFFSASAPLQLQTLRLGSPAFSSKGVAPLQELLSRLIHLSTLSLHGFRQVTAEHWKDIMARISFRWIEVFEIVSRGYDDGCAQYLGERIRYREQMPPESTSTSPDTASTASVVESAPPYVARSSKDVPAPSAAPASTNSGSPLESRSTRRASLSSRLFGSISAASAGSYSRLRSNDKDHRPKESTEEPSSPTALEAPRSSPSQKYLEIDLRYTDVSSKGLVLLRNQIQRQAKKIIVKTGDGEDEDGEEESKERSVEARLATKLQVEKENDERWKRASKGRAGSNSASMASSSLIPYAYHASSTIPPHQQGSSEGSSESNGERQAGSQPPSTTTTSTATTSTFRKFKTAFSKK